MRHRWAILAGAWLPALAAHADSYYYTGPNTVNVAGSACRGVKSSLEASLYHNGEGTVVRSGTQRLLCPIPRRSTSIYSGVREDGTRASQASATEKHVNISAIDVKGSDGSSADTFTCYIFGANLANQTISWGASKTLCSQSTAGCASNGASWKGGNTMRLAAPSGLSGIETVNFGVICDLGPLSTLAWLEATISPN